MLKSHRLARPIKELAMGLSFGDVFGKLAGHLPFAIVVGIGIIAALVRWQRHPRVSALLVGTLTVSLAANVALAIVTLVSIERLTASQSTFSGDVQVIQFPVIAVLSAFVGMATWIAMLVAAFGWRQPASHVSSRQFDGWQFSLRGLMLLTLAVAVLCAAVRGVAEFLATDSVLLRSWVTELPIIVCWLFGLQLAIRRWHWHPAVSRLVLVAIALSFLGHSLFFLMLFWTMRPGGFESSRPGGLLLVYSLSALLSMVTRVLLIVAALGWRHRQAPGEDPILLEAADAAGL
jgi:hypothetical protein